MAEANTEMMEEQLKRNSGSARMTPSGGRPAASENAVKSSTISQQTYVKATPVAPRILNGLDEPRTAGTASVPPRKSIEERTRPMSLQLPRPKSMAMANEPASPSTATEGKGVFNFWNGGKKKLPGGLGTVTIPSPAQVRAALPSSRPGTPTGERSGFDFLAAFPSIDLKPDVPPTKSSNARPNADPQGLPRSMSQSALTSLPTSPPTRQASTLNPSGTPHVTELSRMRQANVAAQGRLNAMGKELAELKKGKVEMEAELENLSQALFEEANKMVSDERRKRAEVEESLKEVRDEREVLKETIKVLGGKVEEETGEEEETFRAASFEPRDLDKHYEALRKTIHHVAEGMEGTRLEDLAATTISSHPQVETRTSSGDLDNTLPRKTSFFHDNALAPVFDISTSSHVAEPTSYAVSPDGPVPVESNPWSDPLPAEPTDVGTGILDGPVDRTDDAMLTSPVDGLDRLMAKLEAEMQEKGNDADHVEGGT